MLCISFLSLFSAQSEDTSIQDDTSSASSYDYNYDYDDEEEVASEETQREGEEVVRASFNPQFTTEAQHFKVPAQHTIRLPCRVDRLGRKIYFVMFKCVQYIFSTIFVRLI